MPVVNRTYRHVERQWLTEFLTQFRAGAKVEYEKKLTRPDPVGRAAMSGTTKPRAAAVIIAKLDAFIALPDHVEIWEAKQYPYFAAVSQLLQYAQTWPHSSEVKGFESLPVELHLLASHDNATVRNSAAANGVEWAQYLPDWLRVHQLQVQREGADRRAAYLASQKPAS